MSQSDGSPTTGRRPSVHRSPDGWYETAQHYVGDLIYGANDGILTTFAVVAGVSGGALSSRAVLIVGIANLFADGLSMGVGNYLSIRARESALEHQRLPDEEAHPVRHTGWQRSSHLSWLVPCHLSRILFQASRADSPLPPAVRLSLSSASGRYGRS